jgi:putative ABC transport system permease protein
MLARKLARDLWQVKGQVVTIALVVASGIAAFGASFSTYQSLKRMQADYYDAARFAHVFAAARRAPLHLEERLLAIDGVADVQTSLVYDALLDLPEVIEPMIARLVALPAHSDGSALRMNRLTLMAGRWIDAPASNQVLVSETFAKARQLSLGSAVHVLLNGKREVLTIVGIVLSPEYILAVHPGSGDDKSFGVFWIGRERLAAAFNMEGAFNQAALRLAREASERAVIGAVDHVLEPYGTTGAFGRAEQLSHQALTQEINEQKVFGLVLPAVFLGVAVFLLNVVLTRQIGTQRGQIAALKALGCPDWRIALHYLTFVLAIVALGIVIGTLAAAWLGQMLTNLYVRYFHFPVVDYRLTADIVAIAAAASLLAAAAGALQALLRVVRLPPAEAMRPASPTTFRATIAERLGFGHLYSPAVRIILRDIERRPGRAVLTTLGIAAAVAIIISGTWWGDAIDYLIEVEFRYRERQDVSLVLAESASSTVEYDLAGLPGVIRAEGDRTAAVRLRNGHLSYRTTVIGFAPDAQLRTVLGPGLTSVPLSGEGLVLNRLLADRLRVGRGDTVQIEFLQGARVQRALPVVGLAAESMGLLAYMDRDALNRLIGEGDSISGARVRLDPAARDSFLRQVKETPRLAFAIETGPIVRNFRDTSARNILVFTAVLSILAGIIAVGVVYNNARIALAERAWELASLRVLGFTRGEVSGLLLGELALELLLALPLGWVCGYGLSFGIVQMIHPETFKIPLIIEPRTYAWASAVVLAAGIVSALIVRRQIDKLNLVGVLKTRE